MDGMSRAAPLPTALRGRAFTVVDARSHGVSASRLRARDLVIPTRGVRAVRLDNAAVPADETPSQRMERLRDDMLARATRIAPALPAHQFFSHDLAVAAIGGPLPYTTARRRDIHVSARHPAGQPRRAGVIGHRLRERDAAPWRAHELPIEHPARIWRQVGATWDLDDLIALGDYLVNPKNGLITIDDLRGELDAAGDVAGGVLARALEEIRVGAETPEETRLRLEIVRAGLPEPQLNWRLFDDRGVFIARVDLAYPQFRVAPESDGRVHAFDEKQFARDADRWAAIRAAGWDHVRILSHHLRPDPSVAVRKVADALVAAGWRPGAS